VVARGVDRGAAGEVALLRDRGVVAVAGAADARRFGGAHRAAGAGALRDGRGVEVAGLVDGGARVEDGVYRLGDGGVGRERGGTHAEGEGKGNGDGAEIIFHGVSFRSGLSGTRAAMVDTRG